MELKKSPKADLQNKKSLFFEIGLTVSLLLMIGMFAWSQSEKTIEKIDMGLAPVEEVIMEVTRQDQKPPEPVKQTIAVVSDIINVVKDDAKITTEFTFTDFDEDAIVIKEVAKKEEAVVADEPFIIVEQMPKFQGGDLEAFRRWVQGKIQYPSIAAENGIQGRVVLQFVIEKDGSLSSVQVLQTPDASLSQEASRVLNQSPKWTPGKQRNMAARVKFTLPVEFRLN